MTLIVALLAAAGAQAGTTVLYETGWETAPARPAWVSGDVAPQNSWVNQNSTAGHQVVANGTQGGIVTPSGTQFHKFTASPDTATVWDRLAWTDISAPFAARPAGQNIVRVSFDAYIPSSQAAVPALYGVDGFHDTDLPWGVQLDPSDRSVNILVDDNYPDYTPAAFAYNTWFNVAVTANYTSGEIKVYVNGVNLPELTRTSVKIRTGALTDVDLVAKNYDVTAPGTRIAYSDNFRVTVEDAAAVQPSLTIVTGPAGKSHLSWAAGFSNWVLESTVNLDSHTWTNLAVNPSISAGVASVDLTNTPPRKFYRLRKP